MENRKIDYRKRGKIDGYQGVRTIPASILSKNEQNEYAKGWTEGAEKAMRELAKHILENQ